MDAFGHRLPDQDLLMVDYLDQSAFDEKFEVDIAADTIRNIYHVENKYYVPVLAGGYQAMFSYARKHMVHPDDAAYARLMEPDNLKSRLREAGEGGVVKMECRQRLVDGSYRWVQYMGIAGGKNGVPEGKVYFYVFDIQNQKDRQNGRPSVAHSITDRDGLTGLLVREAFIPAAERLMLAGQGPWCCIAVDIQHFKVFNAWFGQEKGTYMIARIGAALREFENRCGAAAAYFGRDNFGVFTRYDEEIIRALFDRVKGIVNDYSNAVGFMPAFGVYVLEDDIKINLDIYDRARMAVEEAKSNYLERIRLFDSVSYNKKKSDHERLITLQQAIEGGEIGFFLQPQCRISTGKIVGAEALVRWFKPDGTIINPMEFVPYLEKNGFITELDKCVWEAVCRWLRSAADRGLNPVPVSVNVSRVDLFTMDVAAYLSALTEKYHLPARLLKVEITESAYAEDMDSMNRTVAALKEKGFMVLMDDFGAGYSSLNMLDKITVDVLKLDMAFMRRNQSLNKRGISIVEAIISMTKTLNIPVIIEGVENGEQISFLRNLGCRYAQGYYFHKPMAAEAFERLIEDKNGLDPDGFRCRATELFHTREFLNEALFTDVVLNNILGPVAFYAMEGQDVTICRFNEPFYRAIGDVGMEKRLTSIQNYIVKEDWPQLYRALQDAQEHITEGGTCEVRFYKSDESIFWFRMHLFYLRKDGNKSMFYGQVEDVTEAREQSLHFLEVLRKQADVTMRLNLDQCMIQYVTGATTLYEVGLPSIDLNVSVKKTAQTRIAKEEDRRAFEDFFDVDRLKAAYHKAVYHETLTIDFRLKDKFEPVEFATYYIRHSKDQDLIVYAFAFRKG